MKSGDLPSQVCIDRERSKRSLAQFTKRAFNVIEPRIPYTHGWHIDAICEHLEEWAWGNSFFDLVINIPPGHMKSMLTCVFLPAWVWSKAPEKRWIFASYGFDLARRDSLKTAELCNSPWYQARWPDTTLDRANSEMIETSAKGFRIATSVDGTITGKHAHYQVIDDPMKAQEAHSVAAREGALRFVKDTLSTRRLPGGRRVIIMQRLHEDDPSGHMLREGGWEHLCLPEEYEPGRKKLITSTTHLKTKDPRTVKGELLWPDFFSANDHASRLKSLGSYGIAGQLQQRPAPEEGGIVKRSVLRVYKKMPDRFDMTFQSWDGALSGESHNDAWAGASFGIIGADLYLLPNRVVAQLTFPQAIDAMMLMHERYKHNECAIVIENKAGGKPAHDTLKLMKVPALKLFDPGTNDKMVRVHAIIPFLESGNFYVPSEELDPTIESYIDELISFPNSSHDDQVDMTTQAILWWRASRGNYGPIKFTDAGKRESPNRIE